MISAAIITNAISAGTEAECPKNNCPKRLGHHDRHDTAEIAWTVPADWTLANQIHFSRQLQHGAHIASDMRSHPSYGDGMERMFADYDHRAGLDAGASRSALTAFADWAAASAMSLGTPAAPRTEVVILDEDQDECVETDYDRRGDCDGPNTLLRLKANNNGARVGDKVTMCASHANQAVKRAEATIIEIAATAGTR